MNVRMPLSDFPKPALDAMMALERHLSRSALGKELLELVKLRCSQLNGCAFCIDMHYKNARAAGETEQRLYGLPAWRESPYYDARERAALEWAEAVTRLGPEGVSEASWRKVREVLEPAEAADLTLAVVAINGWNRLNVAMRTKAGDYEVGMFG